MTFNPLGYSYFFLITLILIAFFFKDNYGYFSGFIFLNTPFHSPPYLFPSIFTINMALCNFFGKLSRLCFLPFKSYLPLAFIFLFYQVQLGLGRDWECISAKISRYIYTSGQENQQNLLSVQVQLMHERNSDSLVKACVNKQMRV